jgi:hypothetical protein
MSNEAKTPRRIALEEITAERNRQVKDLGWHEGTDDEQNRGSQLAKVAALYTLAAVYNTDSPLFSRIFHSVWPSSWLRDYWKPNLKSRRRRLVVAGALLLAELERLSRAGECE